MTYHIILTIITVLCCSEYSAFIEGTGSYYSDNQPKWNEAFETCQKKQERLPSVKLSELGLQLADQIHWNPNECFWIGATYEHNANYPDGTFPSVCCGTVRKQDGRPIFECSICQEYVHFVCESDANTVSTYEPRFTYLPWTDAYKECHGQRLFLPSETNHNFLRRVDTAAWWINVTKILNLSPRTAKKGDIPLCFCNTKFMDLQCPADAKTHCLPYSNSNISTTSSIVSSTQSIDTYSAKLTAIVTSISGKTLSEDSYATASIDTRFQSVTQATVLKTGNGTLVGGFTGAAVALIGTITIVIIIKWIRRKRRANDDVNLRTRVNARSTKDGQPQQNVSYDTVFEDDFTSNDTKTAPPQKQTVLLEHALHTQPQNIKDIRVTNKDDNDPPVYDMVQKDHRKKSIAEAIKACDDGDNKYVKIDFNERSVFESSEHVYDKAKLHDFGRYGENDENVYNETDYSFKVFGKNGSSTYDIANFSRIDGSYGDTASKIDGSIDQVYDHI